MGSMAGAGSAAAASLHPIGDFDQPIYVTSSPTDSDRLLVAEREGQILEVTPQGRRQLAELSGLIACCESERGLLSIATAPDFESSGRFYVTYTGVPAAGGDEGDVHLDSFRPDPAGGALIREPILSVAHSSQLNHNGGQLQFGPDGHLYLSLGDGGGSGDPSGNAQNTGVLLGKILRIDPRPGEVPSYSIPPGNPFAAGGGRAEIWDYGLRNPWRFSFDRQTRDLIVADVGQDAREEIDFISSGGGTSPGAGLNFGWNCREGFIAFSGAPAGCAPSGFAEPVFDYPHEDPGTGAAHGCSIIGGYVVRDASVPDLYGRYVYSDFCSAEVRSIVLSAGGGAGDRSEGLPVAKPTSFGQDSCGRVYVASEKGPVYRLEGPAPAVCPRPAATGVRGAPISVTLRRTTPGRLLLSAKRLRPEGLRFRVKVQLTPCDAVGRPMQLNRNGKSFSSKHLNRRCRARFLLTVAKPTPLRAFVRVGGEGDHVASHRLLLRPPRRR
jgi:hypothetical protein